MFVLIPVLFLITTAAVCAVVGRVTNPYPAADARQDADR